MECTQVHRGGDESGETHPRRGPGQLDRLLAKPEGSKTDENQSAAEDQSHTGAVGIVFSETSTHGIITKSPFLRTIPKIVRSFSCDAQRYLRLKRAES